LCLVFFWVALLWWDPLVLFVCFRFLFSLFFFPSALAQCLVVLVFLAMKGYFICVRKSILWLAFKEYDCNHKYNMDFI
jgi:hypothetical protein